MSFGKFKSLHGEDPPRQIIQTAEVHSGKVSKRGLRSGSTFGHVSADLFTLTNQERHNGKPSLDWIVTNAGSNPFSVAGDSGAWVYDTDGCAVGVVVGRATGFRQNRVSGIFTPEDCDNQSYHFISPINAVLQDIERVTGCKVTLNLDL